MRSVGQDEVDGEFGGESRRSGWSGLHVRQRRLRRVDVGAHFLPRLREDGIRRRRRRHVGGEAAAGGAGDEGGGCAAEHRGVRIGSLGLARSERKRKRENGSVCLCVMRVKECEKGDKFEERSGSERFWAY